MTDTSSQKNTQISLAKNIHEPAGMDEDIP